MTDDEKKGILKLIGDMGIKIPEQCVDCIKKEACIIADCIKEKPCNRRETIYYMAIDELRF